LKVGKTSSVSSFQPFRSSLNAIFPAQVMFWYWVGRFCGSVFWCTSANSSFILLLMWSAYTQAVGPFHMHKNAWAKRPLVNWPRLNLSWWYTGASFRAKHQYIHSACNQHKTWKHAKTLTSIFTRRCILWLLKLSQ
jgi:hypothetical protein